MSREASLAAIRQFQSETDAIREAPEPLAARAAVVLLTSALVALFALSFFAQVDRVITSRGGSIVSTETPQVFQALDASIIKSVDVKEGDVVSAGRLLATLDPTFAAADVEQLKQQGAALSAQIERARAEQLGRKPAFDVAADPALAPYAALQTSLFEQRASALKAQLRSFDEKIATAEATIQKYRQDEARYRDHEEIAAQIEDMRSKLKEKGAGSLLNLLVASDAKVEMLRNLEQDQNGLNEAEHSLSSLKADRDAAINQWNAAVSQEIVTAQSALDQAQAQLVKASRRQELVRLVAPGPAMVLSIAKLSVGSVLREGEPFITLAPLSKPVEAEIRISSRDIGFVRAGDPVTLKIDAFNFYEHGAADGRVRWISEGAFSVDDDGKPTDSYYKARVSIDRTDFTAVPSSFRLIPGMTLSGDVKVGTRSVFRYLMGGFVRGAGEAMREP